MQIFVSCRLCKVAGNVGSRSKINLQLIDGNLFFSGVLKNILSLKGTNSIASEASWRNHLESIVLYKVDLLNL